jgi:hypothetical protein
MTTENASPQDMTDEELEAAQVAADGEKVGTDPTQATETEAAATEAAATAAAEAAAATTTAEAAAATAAGAEAAETSTPARVEGVASKDGSRILPYAALQAERRSARVANSRLESVTKELDDAKQLIADLKAGKTPESLAVTEDDVQQMEEDFPEQGKKMRALFEAAQAAESNKPEPKAADVDTEDPVQDAIDQVPLLVEWQHGDAEKFGRAQALDTALKDSPKWRDKPAVARFEHVAKLVAEEYDIQVPEPKASSKTTTTPSAAATQAAAAATRANPNTLSDFKGGAVADHGTADLQKMPATSMLNRFMDMSDADIDAQLAKLG